MHPNQFYKANVAHFTTALSKLKKQLFILSLVRFTVFVMTFYGTYLLRDTTKYAVLLFVIGIAVFLFLVGKYTDKEAKTSKTRALKELNELELTVAAGDISQLATGAEFVNPQHYYSYDIDLFGEKSFFQFLNRTATQAGKEKLAALLTANDTAAVVEKQEAIKELSKKGIWTQEFRAVASLIGSEVSIAKSTRWLESYKSFLPKYIKHLPKVFALGTILVALAVYFDFLTRGFFYAWFALGLVITGKHLKNINNLYHKVSKLKDTFVQNQQLISLLENEDFTSDLLQKKKSVISRDGKPASAILKEFSSALEAFDYRNNIIFAVFGNALFLWDLKQSYRIEQWLESYSSKVAQWFETIAFFDAEISLATYAFNHQSYVYPNLVTNNTCFNAEKLGHPLLPETKRVDNDFNIDNKQFFIITGANMAGKSTFLRTVSLAIIMANTGLPVCAKNMDYKPIKLITSMRTSDSLSDDESYFFSELKRLKFIVDEVSKESYFIILDEILKGTNSTDKAEGSYKFVKRLLGTKATGIIATHDLSLCRLENEEKAIANHYFDAEITNDELFFDYTFKKGICQNMNASFLLKKMDIV